VKLGQIANKKVISTFVASMMFLLVLYVSLSQVNIKKLSNLSASVNDAVRIEETILDTNENISKENGLTKIEYVTVGGYDHIVLKYSETYNLFSNALTPSRGAQYFDGHKETYYSQNVLPGPGLNIPGRHVADDGTIRDGEGYISVAADPSFMARGTTLMTSLGPAKVYDTGCAYGTIDIYVNW
jgi:hypothetical protein